MIDRVDLTANERVIWLCAYAYASGCLPDEGVTRLMRAEHYAMRADSAVASYRELLAYRKPQEPVR